MLLLSLYTHNVYIHATHFFLCPSPWELIAYSHRPWELIAYFHPPWELIAYSHPPVMFLTVVKLLLNSLDNNTAKNKWLF